MPQEHELRLKINAAAAKSGSREFVGALKNIRAAVKQLDRDTNGAFTKLSKKQTVTIDSRSAAKTAIDLDKAAKGVSRFETQAKRTGIAAAAALRTSSDQAAKLSKRLTALGDTSSVSKLNSELSRLQANLQSAKNPLDVSGARSNFAGAQADLKSRAVDLEAIAKSEERAALAASKHSSELQSLAKKWDPIRAASMRYSDSLEEIQRLEQSGVFSASAAMRARERAASQLQQGAVAVGKYGQALKVNQFHVTNFNHQIQDIIVSAPHQSLFTVMTQQGLQLSSVMNQLGTRAAVLTTMRSAFTTLLNPMTLAALAFTGIAAAAVKYSGELWGSVDASKALEDRMTALQTLSTNLDANIDILSLSITELADKYGSAAVRVREFAILQSQLRIAELTRQMQEQSTALEDVAGRYYTLNNGGHQFRNTLSRIGRDFGITGQAARDFETAIQNAATASTFDEQVTSLQEVQRLLKDAGVSASDLPPELAAALSKMIELSNETDAAKALADKLADSVSEIAPSLDPAVDTAAALSQELANALALQNRLNQQDSLVYSGRGGDPRKFENGPQYTRELNYKSPAEIIAEAERAASRKSGGAGRTKRLSDEQRATENLTKSINDRLTSLQNEAITLDLLATKQFESRDAAQLAAQVMEQNGGVISQNTALILQQIDAQSLLNEQLKNAVPLDISQVASDGLKTGLKQGLSAALQGDTKNFAKTLASSVQSSIADALSTKIVDSLGIDQLFNVGFNAAAVRMQTAIVTGGVQAGNAMATAIRTGQASAPVSGGGGGFLGLLGGLFGIPVAAEGMTTSGISPVATTAVNPAAFRHAPSYSAGTANTSGIPAILHDNEAVVPLTKGRRIPVDMGNVSNGGSVYAPSIGDVITNVTFEGTDDQTSEEQGALIAETIAVTVDNKINERFAENMQYGSIMKPRGS